MGISVAPAGFIMSSRFHLAWLGGVFIVTIGQSVAVAQPHPHSQPPGRRVGPLPAGEGGSLYVQAPLQLCADNMYEFHLHQRAPERGEVLYVLEAPAGPSSCQWEIHDLAEGTYYLRKYPLQFDSAVERLDLEIAPGVIQVVVPPLTSAHDSSWASVSLRPIKVQAVPDGVLSANGSSFGFKPKEGRRGNYIGVPYGEYEVFLTIGTDQDAAKVASARVTLSEGNEMASVTLSPVIR